MIDHGAGLAKMLKAEQRLYDVTVGPSTPIDARAVSFTSFATTAAAVGADCFFFAGRVSAGAVALIEAVHAALPLAKLFGGDGICTSAFTA